VRRLNPTEIRARNAVLEEAKGRFRAVHRRRNYVTSFTLDEAIRLLDDLKIQEPIEVVFTVTRLDDGKRKEGR